MSAQTKNTPVLNKTFDFDAALTTWNLVAVASNVNAGNCMLAAGVSATGFVGITQEPTANDSSNPATVMTHGITQVQSDGNGTITAGQYLTPGTASSGQVRAITPATGTTARQVIGIALTSAAGTSGLLVDVLIQPFVFIGA